MQEEIRAIRNQLRLAMNGTISSSMRAKGIVYKLNFGVPYPEIRQIARSHTPGAELADALWRENIREFKILATLLYPAAALSPEEALRWVGEIPYMEIAEYAAKQLFANMPEREAFVARLFADRVMRFAPVVALLTCAECFRRGDRLSPAGEELFLREGLLALGEERSFSERQAARQALRFYGRRSEADACRALDGLDTLAEERGDAALRELREDLSFEYAFYKP